MTYGPSEHLSWHELACHDGTPYPQQWRNGRALVLGEVFEMIRAYFGGFPIIVGSAFRTFSHNAAVGGATASRHLHGDALDLYPPAMFDVREFLEGILGLARVRGTIRGLGLYPLFVHVDLRPSAELVRWNGGRIVPEGAKA